MIYQQKIAMPFRAPNMMWPQLYPPLKIIPWLCSSVINLKVTSSIQPHCPLAGISVYSNTERMSTWYIVCKCAFNYIPLEGIIIFITWDNI